MSLRRTERRDGPLADIDVFSTPVASTRVTVAAPSATGDAVPIPIGLFLRSRLSPMVIPATGGTKPQQDIDPVEGYPPADQSGWEGGLPAAERRPPRCSNSAAEYAAGV